EAQQPGNVHHPVVHLSALGAPRHFGRQALEQRVRAGERSGQHIDPRAPAERDALGFAQRRQTRVVDQVEQRSLQLHATSVTQNSNVCSTLETSLELRRQGSDGWLSRSRSQPAPPAEGTAVTTSG